MDRSGAAPCINIIIANMPVSLADTLENEIGRCSDLRLLENVSTYGELPFNLMPNVDVVLLGIERTRPLPSICSYLLENFPHLRVIALSLSADTGSVYWLELHQEWMQSVSTELLIDQIRLFHNQNSV